MSLRGATLLLLPSLAACAPATKGYAGTEVCGSCHAAESRSQAATGHALALRRAAEHPLAAAFFHERTLRAPEFRFEFLAGPTVRISDGNNVAEAPIEWAFGAGQQAVTFVSRVDARFYVEHYFSYYRATDALGPTPGQQDLHPSGLGEAAGLYYKTRDADSGIDSCFSCHSTGPLRFEDGNTIRVSEPGVHCEACHGPGAAHVEAARNSKPAARLINNPGRLSAEKQLEFCGTCHRPPQPRGKATDWSFPWNVRHQPVYLAQSACYRESKGALSCTTCHAAHQPLAKTVESYNRKCTGCHQRTPAACASNCVDCHMPRVSPQSPLIFTNHWIGIYDSAAKLVPRRTAHTRVLTLSP